jgi:hypothetical protein
MIGGSGSGASPVQLRAHRPRSQAGGPPFRDARNHSRSGGRDRRSRNPVQVGSCVMLRSTRSPRGLSRARPAHSDSPPSRRPPAMDSVAACRHCSRPRTGDTEELYRPSVVRGRPLVAPRDRASPRPSPVTVTGRSQIRTASTPRIPHVVRRSDQPVALRPRATTLPPTSGDNSVDGRPEPRGRIVRKPWTTGVQPGDRSVEARSIHRPGDPCTARPRSASTPRHTLQAATTSSVHTVHRC